VRGENAMVGALLGEARPTALEGDRLTVCFPAAAEFSKKKAEANRPLLAGALRGLTGRSLTLAYDLSDDGPEETVTTLSEDELLERLKSEFGAREIFDDDDPSGGG
jgi:hypothetical protein